MNDASLLHVLLKLFIGIESQFVTDADAGMLFLVFRLNSYRPIGSTSHWGVLAD